MPFATGCGNQPDYGRCLSDMPKEHYRGIEPDKVGELGIGYAKYYELTGDRAYLRAAIRCANALAAHVLRLAFRPATVTAGGQALHKRGNSLPLRIHTRAARSWQLRPTSPPRRLR